MLEKLDRLYSVVTEGSNRELARSKVTSAIKDQRNCFSERRVKSLITDRFKVLASPQPLKDSRRREGPYNGLGWNGGYETVARDPSRLALDFAFVSALELR
jgi:hypothetical protein